MVAAMLAEPGPEAPSRRVLGPYRLVEVLGRGGMGVVYRGEHEQTGEPVAIKTVLSAEEGMLAGIRREIHALSRIDHPGVVKIVDQGVADGLPWYGMELLEGRTLRKHLQGLRAQRVEAVATSPVSGPPTIEASQPSTIEDKAFHETLRHGPSQPPISAPSEPRILIPTLDWRLLMPTLTVLRRLCAPLAFLHGSGIVHRDLKPENVFLRQDSAPILVDFGIASQFSGALGREALQAAGKVMGTYLYMAPEQIRGEFVDARADLYALGCILYESVTGQPPFASAKGEHTLYSKLHQPPVPPSRLVEGVGAELETLILKLLEVRPQDRLGYAEDVAAILGALGAEAAEPASAPRAQLYLYRPDFAGRADAQATIQRAIRAAKRGHGAMIFLGGESGAGKTRLAMEAARDATLHDLTVVTGECLALSVAGADGGAAIGAAPLYPLRSLLLAIADRCREGAPEVERLLGPEAKVLAAYEPSLADLPELRDRPDPPALPAGAARARVLRALAAALFALAEQAPLLLVLDDLQWADELSLSFLQELSPGDLADRGLLLIGTYRMEEMNPALGAIVRAEGAIHLEIGRLDEASIDKMVCGMLALRRPPRALLDFLSREADGNPFFIAEYVRAAIGEGLLDRGPDGEWRLGARGGAAGSLDAPLPLPSTLADLIERRLADLTAPARALVRAASVLGRELDGDVLIATAGQRDATGMVAIETLRLRQILEEAAGGRLRFVHDRIREITYHRIPASRRRELHRRAAEVIEARCPDAPDRYSSLAHHFAKARVHDRAATCFVRAAERARAAYANQEAIGFYHRAIASVQQVLRARTENIGKWVELLSQVDESLGEVLALTGRQGEARDLYADAVAQIPESDRRGRARIYRKIGKTWETHHRHDEALRAYSAAEACLGDEPASPDESWWQEWIGVQIDRISVHYWLAQVDTITALVERVRPAVEARAAPAERAQFFQALVQLGIRRERYLLSADTVRDARACLSAREEAGEPGAIATARFGLACALLWHGAFDESEEQMLATLQTAEQRGDAPLQSRCLTYLTMIARRRGRLSETKLLAERSLAVATATQMDDYIGAARANLAWVAWRARSPAAAEEGAAAALQRWSGREYVFPFQWTALLPLAAAALARDDVAEAALRAKALLDPKQQRLPDALAGALEAAIAAWERGETRGAREHLAQALEAAERLGYA
jgi:eukaryotic-like serine/threonine-protein kinase